METGAPVAPSKRLLDQRILVVGASSGIGLAVARAVAAEGAAVAVAARRSERLAELAAEVPAVGVVTRCDVRDPDDCEAVVAAATRGMGGLDALVFAVGRAMLVPIAEAAAGDWQEIFETNVIGASLITRAALPHLEKARGRALYLSSISAGDRPPRRGLGLYLASKAALNRMIDVWQEEHHAIRFTRLNVGDTGGTDMAADWDMTRGGPIVQEWIEKGFMFGRAMVPESVAHHIVDLLASREAIPVSTIVPRFAENADDETH